MNKRVKKMWVEALPQYTQGKGTLRGGNEFCCLGVLCDLYAKEKGCEWEASDFGSREYTFLGVRGVLPLDVFRWAGLPNGNPDVGKQTLVDANDGGKTFTQISNLIQRYL